MTRRDPSHSPQDAHELRRTRAALRLVRQVVGHDLRSPLQAVTGCAELLAGPMPGFNDTRRLAMHLTRSSARLAEMLLATSALVDDTLRPMTWEPVDLAELVGPLHNGESASGLPPVAGDPLLLGILVQALLGNARQHGAPPIVVSAAVDDGSVRLTVSDLGPGFVPGHAAALFQPFFRKGLNAGAGVGLARARRIAQDHGGDVEAVAPPTGGAIFRAWWPLQPPWFAPRTE